MGTLHNDMGAYGWNPDKVTYLDDDEKTTSIIPIGFELSQNYPNPFNPFTAINYQIPITDYVNLSIYNPLGQKVATLVGKIQPAGIYQVQWDAGGYASGVYYYKVETGDFRQVKKMILLR